jgi:dextranase
MIVPAKASFRPGEPIQAPVPGPALKVSHLGRPVWYDFLVANGDLLFAQGCAAPGDTHAGEDFRLVGDVLISDDARPGTIWQQIRHTGHGPVIHLVDLIGQPDARWTTPEIDCRPIRGLTLRLRHHGPTPSTVWVGDPERGPDPQPLTVTPDGHGHVIAALPPLGKWQLIHLSGRSL